MGQKETHKSTPTVDNDKVYIQEDKSAGEADASDKDFTNAITNNQLIKISHKNQNKIEKQINNTNC